MLKILDLSKTAQDNKQFNTVLKRYILIFTGGKSGNKLTNGRRAKKMPFKYKNIQVLLLFNVFFIYMI
jgi:hypothetical protein